MPEAKPITIAPLTGTLDARSTPDLIPRDGVRMRQNLQLTAEGKETRGTGWSKLLTKAGYNNADFHDQLLTFDGIAVPVTPASLIIMRIDTNNPGFNDFVMDSVTRMGGTSYLVGNGVFSSSDDLTWAVLSAFNAGNAIDNNGTLLVTFINDEIYSSPDGINWTLRHTATATLYGLCYAAGRFVAVGDGISMYSTDGITWTAGGVLGGGGDAYANVVYGAGLFVTFGDTNELKTSPTGETWTLRHTFTLDTPRNIAFGNGIFVIASGDTIHTSTDGITWTRRVLAETSGASLRAVSFVSGEFVLSGQTLPTASKSFRSSDGLTWVLDRDWTTADYAIVGGASKGGGATDHHLVLTIPYVP